MRSSVVGHAAVLLVIGVVIACAGGDTRESDTSRGDSSAAVVLDTSARCFRSAESVLLGPSRGGTSEGTPPGWIRLEGLGADSGMARLADANGAGLQGQWRRTPGDTVHFAGFDDFLRVEMKLVVTGSGVAGPAVATSDAAAERDSAGRPGDLRREWSVSGTEASCDSMPVRGN